LTNISFHVSFVNWRCVMENRLKMLRLAKGLSLEELSARMGRLVTKQALSKIESGTSHPSPLTKAKLAAALGVKAVHLWASPEYSAEIIAYRKTSKLRKGDSDRLENCFKLALERRAFIQGLLWPGSGKGKVEPPIQEFGIGKSEETEEAAQLLRDRWNLGKEPIGNLVGTLEEWHVHVIEVDTTDGFHGLSGFARDSTGRFVAAAVATRSGVPGERQRSNVAHELAHMVTKPAGRLDHEKIAQRFASAFLAPKETLLREVGQRRSFMPFQELAALKRRYGMSMQALVYRLHDLSVINDSYYTQWFRQISKLGWRKDEPFPLPAEKPEWFTRNVFHAFAEGLIGKPQAEELLGEAIERPSDTLLIGRQEFMRLPLEKRREILNDQAARLEEIYNKDQEISGLGGGDFLDYD
jgi:transcriptional regulator with XRE-family HTH domain